MISPTDERAKEAAEKIMDEVENRVRAASEIKTLILLDERK